MDSWTTFMNLDRGRAGRADALQPDRSRHVYCLYVGSEATLDDKRMDETVEDLAPVDPGAAAVDAQAWFDHADQGGTMQSGRASSARELPDSENQGETRISADPEMPPILPDRE
jgi:hypothetical protein